MGCSQENSKRHENGQPSLTSLLITGATKTKGIKKLDTLLDFFLTDCMQERRDENLPSDGNWLRNGHTRISVAAKCSPNSEFSLTDHTHGVKIEHLSGSSFSITAAFFMWNL